MIGGRDIIIPATRGTDALDFAVRAVSRFWPCAVLEDGESGESLRHYANISFAGTREILAFRDSVAAKLWDEIGPDPSLDGTLIHFLRREHELTVSIDAAPSPEIASFVQGLRHSLAQDLFASTAQRKKVA